MPGLLQQLDQITTVGVTGRVADVRGMSVSVSGLPAPVGAECEILGQGTFRVRGEVIAFQHGFTTVMPYGSVEGIRRGARVRLRKSVPSAKVGPGLIGRVLNAQGEFIDGEPATALTERVPLSANHVSPMNRPRIEQPMATGVRVIDGLLTIGEGQRIGIFAGSGVGKSTLLGQLARQCTADVNVIALVGERGREVREFLERDLGPEGLARSIMIVATSEESALLRLKAAWLATSISEYFRDQGRHVFLMMDSLTRFALAQREIGLSAGEPPATRGYPPSVFALLPRLLERTGRNEHGSITAFYTVLVEGDDTNEPISDTVRGILDGHIVLSRDLAHKNHWPAIDVLASISRTMNDIATPNHNQSAANLRQLLAAYRESEDLISIGAYQSGSNPLVDQAIQLRPASDAFLQQRPDESQEFAKTISQLQELQKRRAAITPIQQNKSANAIPQQQQVAAAHRAGQAGRVA